MKANPKLEAEVLGVMDLFRKAGAERDIDSMLQLFSDDPNVLVTGSEAGEFALGPSQLRDFFESLFSRPFAYIFEWNSYSICNSGNVAWAFLEVEVRRKENGRLSKSKPYRITVILEKQQRKWRIVHYHGSEPATSNYRTSR